MGTISRRYLSRRADLRTMPLGSLTGRRHRRNGSRLRLLTYANLLPSLWRGLHRRHHHADQHLPRGIHEARPLAVAYQPQRLHAENRARHAQILSIGGIAVHIAARILGHAGAGEILVSRTVRDLVVGSGTGFEDRGSVELRGVPGTWQLLAVNRHGPRAGSAEAQLASTPTPGPRTAMRRSDRAVAVMARRTPWILRGMARFTPTVRS